MPAAAAPWPGQRRAVAGSAPRRGRVSAAPWPGQRRADKK